MKGAITENLEKGIIDQKRFVREAASDCAVIPLDKGIEEIAKFWKNLHKITIHRKDVRTGRCSHSFAQGTPDSVRRLAVQYLHTRFARCNFFSDFPRPIGTVVIDEEKLVDVGAVETEDALDQGRDVHFFVVTGDNE